MFWTEIVPGVYKLLPAGLRAWLLHKVFDIELVSYYVDGILIDTGGRYQSRYYVRACRNLNIQAIVNTHCHEEHIGNNAIVQRLKNIPCLIPQGSRCGISPTDIPFYRRLLWGTPEGFDATFIGETVHGNTMEFEVIPTPGHCEHHISLFQRDRGWLFCGDAFTAEDLNYSLAELDGNQLMASLRTLMDLPVRYLFDGHGTVIKNPRAALESKIRYLDSIRSRVNKMQTEDKTPGDMVKIIFGRECLAYYLSLGDFSRKNFVQSFIKNLSINQRKG